MSLFLFVQKHFQQVIEEALPNPGRCNALMIPEQQPAPLGLFQFTA